MKRKLLGALVAIALTSPVLAQSGQEPLVLKPSSAWHVDYADDRCRLARRFGEGDQEIYAFFDRYGPTESFRLILAGKQIRIFSDKGEASVQFGPAENAQQRPFLKGTTGKLPSMVFVSGMRLAGPSDAEMKAIESRTNNEWVELAPISEARQKAVKFLLVGKPMRQPLNLEIGSMRAPLLALEKCIGDLLTTWGIDVEKHRTLTRSATPIGSPGKWVVWDDYPLDMLSAGQPAIVEFRLSVGADGIPSACHIQSTTRPKEFDDAVCKSVMRRARFDPALDAAGQPLASYYRNTVHFQLPSR